MRTPAFRSGMTRSMKAEIPPPPDANADALRKKILRDEYNRRRMRANVNRQRARVGLPPLRD